MTDEPTKGEDVTRLEAIRDVLDAANKVRTRLYRERTEIWARRLEARDCGRKGSKDSGLSALARISNVKPPDIKRAVSEFVTRSGTLTK